MGSWIEPWASSLGVDAVIASRIEVQGDHLTGRMDGPNCHGAEKLRRLLALYPNRGSYTLHAYGDSRGDAALLGAADRRFYRCFA
jgi:phosphatidylglycerophosphatase C